MSPEPNYLGRLVTNMDYPTQGYYHHASLSNHSASTDFSVTTGEEQIPTNNADSPKQVSTSWLKKFFSRFGSSGKRSKNATSITKQVCTYKFHDSDRKFEDWIEEIDVRRWLEHVRGKGCYVYMVVGYQTLIGALSRGEESGVEGGTGVVETKAQAESDDLASIDQVANPESQPMANNEQIYAIQYRRAEFRPLFSMDVRVATLQKRTRWRVVWKGSASEL